jgi:thiamine pyrophosphate-dependent acetolactate synthase large subunit-like protein
MGSMNKTSAIQRIIDATAGIPVVYTTGYACRIANGIADRSSHFYMTGSMGLAAAIAAGVASASGRCTVVVDGDGSLMMNPSVLFTAAAMPSLPLLHIVLDDRSYASTGGQASASANIDFCALAKASGYVQTIKVRDAIEFGAALQHVLPGLRVPTFLHCQLDDVDQAVPPRISSDLDAHGTRFSAFLSSNP